METEQSRPFNAMEHETPEADLKALHLLALEVSQNEAIGWPAGLRAVEVGSWTGRTALVLAHHFSKVYCVDHWQGNPTDRLGPLAARYGPEAVFRAFCGNVGKLFLDGVTPLVGPSMLWASVFPKQVGLIFIDADHRRDHVVNDTLAWRRHLAPGGRLVWHDYGVFPGVTRAVDELYPQRRTVGATLAYVDL